MVDSAGGGQAALGGRLVVGQPSATVLAAQLELPVAVTTSCEPPELPPQPARASAAAALRLTRAVVRREEDQERFMATLSSSLTDATPFGDNVVKRQCNAGDALTSH